MIRDIIFIDSDDDFVFAENKSIQDDICRILNEDLGEFISCMYIRREVFRELMRKGMWIRTQQ